MKDVAIIIFLVLFGLFMLYKIFEIIRKDFIGVDGQKKSAKKPDEESDDDLLIIIDLDEEE